MAFLVAPPYRKIYENENEVSKSYEQYAVLTVLSIEIFHRPTDRVEIDSLR